MKLWQKIFLYTLILVMLAVGITSILLLQNSFELALEQQRKAACREHDYFITNFKSILITERLRQNMIVLPASQVQDFMEDTFGEGESGSRVAFYDRNKELMYQNRESEADGELVKRLLNLVEEGEESYLQLQGRVLYILSRENMESSTYYFLTTTDLSEIFRLHEDMLVRVRFISMLCALAISAILLVVVKLLLHPLQIINEGTRAIAQGEYHRRIQEKGKDEISELAHNMNIMAASVERNVEALEAVAENRKQFIDNLSHEMKTPLTSILGFSDLLMIKKDLPEEKRMEYMGIVSEEAKRMRTLSGKLMELITVGEANVDWQEEEVSQLFCEIAASLDVIAQSHDIILRCKCEEGRLYMDKELMKSLVYNLTDNAIKATGEGGMIDIQGWFEKEVFVFAVADTGIGIPAEEIDRITQAFYMVDKVRSRKKGGAGLGLALCTEIVKLHRGQLQIESKPGQGTVVTVRMRGGSGCGPKND